VIARAARSTDWTTAKAWTDSAGEDDRTPLGRRTLRLQAGPIAVRTIAPPPPGPGQRQRRAARRHAPVIAHLGRKMCATVVSIWYARRRFVAIKADVNKHGVRNR